MRTFQQTDCFILCYSIEDRASFINLLSHWYAEIRDYTESVPIVLVGEFYQNKQTQS